jgi:phosphatidylglycerol:prolipoprotein diacylglycerol transferase
MEALLLASNGNPSVNFFGLPIYIYGIIVSSGIIAAFIIGVLMFKLVGYKDEIAYLLLMLCVPIGIVCARAYYVLFDPHKAQNYQNFFDVINIRGGGIAIYGGVIGGALGILILARRFKAGFFTIADIWVVALIMAQAIGRWGNFVNQEAHGFEVSHHVPPFTVRVDKAGESGIFLATYLYESVLNFIGFGVLLAFNLFKIKRKNHKWGSTSALYLMWYGVSRAIIEPLRADSLVLFGSSTMIINRVSFLLSLAIIAGGVLLWLAVKKGKISQDNKGLLKNEERNK